MMFAKLAVIAAACSTLASAWTTVTAEPPSATTIEECIADNLQPYCCDSAFEGTDPTVETLFNVLDIVLEDPTLLVGLSCTPLNVGDVCDAIALCCSDNNFGLAGIGIACTTIELP